MIPVGTSSLLVENMVLESLLMLEVLSWFKLWSSPSGSSARLLGSGR